MGKFYAVAKGRKSGVFTSWNECKKQIFKFSGAVYKSFKTKQDADDFISRHNFNTILGKRKRDTFLREGDFDAKQRTSKKRRYNLSTLSDGNVVNDSVIEIYTDGSCFGNGKYGAKAGVGVFFGNDVNYKDKRNVSRKLEGSKQTNNRAELAALIDAIKIIKNQIKPVHIYSDSEYSIKGIHGVNEVKKNKDLFLQIFELVKECKCQVHFHKVLAHSGKIDPNHMADELAKKGAFKH